MNDREWSGMFARYYKDHPEAGGYVYLALRAPNDEWDGFYDASISPLVERLIRRFREVSAGSIRTGSTRWARRTAGTARS